MVADTLHNVADHLRIEKGDRQLHHLNKKVGDDGNIDTCTNMQQDPASYQIHGGAAHKKHKLRKQNSIDKAYVAVVDTIVNKRLGKKRKYQLQYRTDSARCL